jgi:hypothetical protein
VAAVVLVAAAAAVLLARSTSDPSSSEVERRAAVAASASAAAALSPTPVPPFDRRPGRTPIPAPVRAGDRLSGTLPATGPPARAAATRAVELVLGRFCADPAAYAYPLGPEALGVAQDWRHVSVALFRIERGASTPSLRLTLDWTGAAYRWTGPADLLAGC